jgi:hypothetical protein
LALRLNEGLGLRRDDAAVFKPKHYYLFTDLGVAAKGKFGRGLSILDYLSRSARNAMNRRRARIAKAIDTTAG